MFLTGPKPDGSMLVVLERGEKIVKSLTTLVTEQQIHGGQIVGVGALKDVELGYYELEKQTYLRQSFLDEDFELLALSGNISLKDNAPFIHVHTVLGKRDFSTFGGHLFEGVVAVTAEITIVPLGKMPKRTMSQLGIALICGF